MTQLRIYLAAPYSHASAKVRDKRAAAIRRAHAQLIHAGHLVYSPICHTHSMAVDDRLKMPTDFEFWQKSCEWFLSMCNTVVVLMLPGWIESVGVHAELEKAASLGIGRVIHTKPDEVAEFAARAKCFEWL